MKKFIDTQEAYDFVESANSRETDMSIMRAIVAHSDNIHDAEYIWQNGLSNFDSRTLNAFINTVTGDKGATDAKQYHWGHSTLADAINDTSYANDYADDIVR